MPGLNVVQSGGPGGQTSVFMRGTDSNHVKVLVDGIDVSDPSSPVDAYDFGQFLTGDIQKVEVLRGPQSGLYGSDAIGGVINVITKSGQGPAQFTASVEGGSFDTFNQSGGVSGSVDGFHYAANIQHFYSGATPVTPEDILPPGQPRIDDRYDNVTASTKLGYDVTDNFDLGLVARYTDSELHFTGDNFNFFLAIPDTQQSIQNDIQYYTRGTAHLSLWGGAFEQTLGFAYTSSHTSEFSPDSGTALDAGDRIKIDWQGNIRVSDGEILVLGRRTCARRTALSGFGGHIDQFGLRGTPVELQSEFLQCDQRPLRRQRPFRQRRHLSRGADLPHSAERNEAEGEHRNRLQGADAQRNVRELSVLRILRQSQPEAGKRFRLGRGLRAIRSSATRSNSARPTFTTTSAI